MNVTDFSKETLAKPVLVLIGKEEEYRGRGQTDQAAEGAAREETGQAGQEAEAAATTEAHEAAQNLERRIASMTSAALTQVKTPPAGQVILEWVRHIMYPIYLIERVVNYLGVIGILSIIAGCIMGSMGKAVPDMIIFGAGTAIGALAGIAQGNAQKEAQTRVAGVPVREVPDEVMELLKQQMQMMQQIDQRLNDLEAA